MGGLGAGAVSFGADGRFREIAINNNRLAGERIAVSPFSGVAVRIAQGTTVYTRILQEQGKDADGLDPLRLQPGMLAWRGLYPVSYYRLKDDAAPAKVFMTAFAPLIPFDHEASIMPVFFLSLRVFNPADEALDVSVAFHWENFCGASSSHTPELPPKILPVSLQTEKPPAPPPIRKGSGQEDEDALPVRISPNALLFGHLREALFNEDGEYCLALRLKGDITPETLVWNPGDPAARATFWKSFEETGHLRAAAGHDDKGYAGAVGGRFRLAPGEDRRIDFVLAWHCPHFVTDGVEHGNGYANLFTGVTEVALQGLKFIKYYFASVEGWRQRILNASLPSWFNHALIDSLEIFPNHAVLTRLGDFGIFEDPSLPCVDAPVLRLHTSLAAQLFFPRFEDAALRRLAGDGTPGLPAFASGGAFPDDSPLACAERVLAIFRAYRFTGNLARIQSRWPQLCQSIEAALSRDRDGDGLPEGDGSCSSARGLNSMSAGLWSAALRAAASLAETLRKPRETKRFEALAAQAAESFDRLFWDNPAGYYRWGAHHNAASEALLCHAGQMAGQWYADLLDLGPIFPPDHISRAIGTIQQWNEDDSGWTTAVLPGEKPSGTRRESGHSSIETEAFFSPLLFACLLLHRANAGDAFRLAEAWLQRRRNYRSEAHEVISKAELLAIWPLFYAVLGLELNIPGRCLRFTPNLPEGITVLKAPLFSTACLGSVHFTEERQPEYRQHFRIRFDSPVRIENVILRVPADIKVEQVACEGNDGPVACQWSLIPGEGAARLHILIREEVTTIQSLAIRVLAGS